jgi:hypothetical protein
VQSQPVLTRYLWTDLPSSYIVLHLVRIFPRRPQCSPLGPILTECDQTSGSPLRFPGPAMLSGTAHAWGSCGGRWVCDDASYIEWLMSSYREPYASCPDGLGNTEGAPACVRRPQSLITLTAALHPGDICSRCLTFGSCIISGLSSPLFSIRAGFIVVFCPMSGVIRVRPGRHAIVSFGGVMHMVVALCRSGYPGRLQGFQVTRGGNGFYILIQDDGLSLQVSRILHDARSSPLQEVGNAS